MSDLFTEIPFGDVLHFSQDHCRDFLWSKDFLFSLDRDLNEGFPSLLNNIKRPVLHVSLDFGLLEPTPNETLGIKDSIVWIRWGLIFGGVTNETLIRVGKGNIGGSNSVSLVIGNNVNFAVLVHANAANTNRRVCVCELIRVCDAYTLEREWKKRHTSMSFPSQCQ